MARLPKPINTDNIEPAPSRAPLPNGDYPFEIIPGEVKQTRAGTGSYIELTCKVESGEHKGRQVWTRFNVSNPNPQAVEIAERQLKQLQLACGVPGLIEDTDQFLGHSFIGNVTVRQSDGYEPQNEFTEYKASGRAAVPPGPSAPAKSRAPWNQPSA